jgi:DnaJ-class molecular chaperone
MNDKDARKVLELGPTGSMVEIKKAYQRLAMIYHPDRKTGDEEKFKKINEAYNVLNNMFHNTYLDNSPIVWLPISILEAFMGCIKTITIGGQDASIRIPEGTLSNDRIDSDQIDSPANVTVVVMIHSDYTIDIGSNGDNTKGNVTKTVFVSPFLMMTGGFLDVDMLDGGFAKVRIPAGLQANSLLKVANRGYFKNYACEDRGDCLLRIVPEIKKLDCYIAEELFNFEQALMITRTNK